MVILILFHHVLPKNGKYRKTKSIIGSFGGAEKTFGINFGKLKMLLAFG